MNFPWTKPPVPTVQALAQDQLYAARVALLAAENDAERAEATCVMLRSRIERLAVAAGEVVHVPPPVGMTNPSTVGMTVTDFADALQRGEITK